MNVKAMTSALALAVLMSPVAISAASDPDLDVDAAIAAAQDVSAPSFDIWQLTEQQRLELFKTLTLLMDELGYDAGGDGWAESLVMQGPFPVTTAPDPDVDLDAAIAAAEAISAPSFDIWQLTKQQRLELLRALARPIDEPGYGDGRVGLSIMQGPSADSGESFGAPDGAFDSHIYENSALGHLVPSGSVNCGLRADNPHAGEGSPPLKNPRVAKAKAQGNCRYDHTGPGSAPPWIRLELRMILHQLRSEFTVPVGYAQHTMLGHSVRWRPDADPTQVFRFNEGCFNGAYRNRVEIYIQVPPGWYFLSPTGWVRRDEQSAMVSGCP